jgi:hypothetical protein
MTDIVKAAKKLIDCVEFDMNGAGGKGGNGGLLSDTTLRAAHDLRVIMSREADREQKKPSFRVQDGGVFGVSVVIDTFRFGSACRISFTSPRLPSFCMTMRRKASPSFPIATRPK